MLHQPSMSAQARIAASGFWTSMWTPATRDRLLFLGAPLACRHALTHWFNCHRPAAQRSPAPQRARLRKPPVNHSSGRAHVCGFRRDTGTLRDQDGRGDLDFLDGICTGPAVNDCMLAMRSLQTFDTGATAMICSNSLCSSLGFDVPRRRTWACARAFQARLRRRGYATG